MKKFLFTALCVAALVGCTEGGDDNGTENGGNGNGGDVTSAVFPLEGRIEKFEIYDTEFQNIDGSLEETYHYIYEMTYDTRGRVTEMYSEAIAVGNKILETERYTFEYNDAAHTAVVTMIYTDNYGSGSEPKVEKDFEQWNFDDAWRVKTVRDLEDPSDVSIYSYDAKGYLLSIDSSDENRKSNTIFNWQNGNLTAIAEKETSQTAEPYTNTQTCEYGNETNPFAGKALNILYTVFADLDLPALVGFTGVGMKNLPTTVSFFEPDYAESPSAETISYEYDAKGRISRIGIKPKTDAGTSENDDNRYYVLHYAE